MDNTYFKKLLYTCTMLSFFLSLSALALQESEGIFIGSFEPPIPKGSHFVRVIPKRAPTVAGYEVNAALALQYITDEDPVLNGPGGGGTSSASTTTPSITVVSPNGGETWAAGSTHTVTWQSTGIPSNFDGVLKLSLYRDGAVLLSQDATIAGNPGTYSIALKESLTPASDYRVRLMTCWETTPPDSPGHTCDIGRSTYATDTSDRMFTISAPLESEKVVACHYNSGVKQYVQLSISRDGWDDGHKNHEKDFIKTGEGTCASLASVGTLVPFDGGATDEPRNIPGLIDQPQPVSTSDSGGGNGSLIRKLQERIKQLEYNLSQREQEVVEREREREKPVNPSLVHRTAGMILLQVKEKGEAWYVDPDSLQKFYLKDGPSAYQALQAFGLGITETDIDQIPVSTETDTDTEDADADGLSDKTEIALGTDVNNKDSDNDGFLDGTEVESGYHPRRTGQWIANAAMCKRLEGKIVLQVNNRGQAWYVRNCKRYYLKNGASAYEVMRYLGLGITNEDLSEVPTGDLSTGE